MKRNVLLTSCLMACIGFTQVVYAHVAPDATRVIYHGGNQFTTVDVKNNDPRFDYGLESYVLSHKKSNLLFPDTESMNRVFMVSPKFMMVPPKNKRVELQIIKLPGQTLPQDRESLFYLEFQEAPPRAAAHGKNVLQIAVRSQIKLIYRPHDIKPISSQNLQGKVSAVFQDGKMVVHNNSPYVISAIRMFNRPKTSAHETLKKSDEVRGNVQLTTTIFKPFSKTVVFLNKTKPSNDRLYLEYIGDYGGVRDVSIRVKNAALPRQARELKNGEML